MFYGFLFLCMYSVCYSLPAWRNKRWWWWLCCTCVCVRASYRSAPDCFGGWHHGDEVEKFSQRHRHYWWRTVRPMSTW